MKILYHKDDDGRCAAAIVSREFENLFMPTRDTDVIGYMHGDEIDYPEIAMNEQVFIVDIALSEEISKFIHHCLDSGASVVHIDHHKTGIDYWDNEVSNTDTMRTSGQYRKFFKDGISGAMLTWIYCSMTEDEKDHAEDVRFDFSDDWSHFMVGLATEGTPDDSDDIVAITACDGRNARERYIPPALRYINDHDVWTHAIPSTRLFHAGFSSEKNKDPLESVWINLLYNNNPVYVSEYLRKGEAILEYLDARYATLRENAHEFVFIPGLRVLCINEPLGNSDVFGDLIKDYDAVCKYGFNGKYWDHEFYSHEASGVDVGALVKELGKIYPETTISCGGHKHAAGIQSEINLTDLG